MPKTDPDKVGEIVSRVGQKIMRLRNEQGLSLQQRAAKSDATSPAIHKIQRSAMVPTITTLLKLSNALGAPLNYFVEEDQVAPELICLTHEGARKTIYTPHKGLVLEGITGSYQQFRSAAAIARMQSGANSGVKFLKHGGEELVHVLSGEVIFTLGDREYQLAPGDSLQFSGEIPHQWRNASEAEAVLVWVVLRND